MEKNTDNKIFIVHGHDEVFMNEVSAFLASALKLDVYLLKDLPNNGRTIIEKLEEETKDTSYAVILLSPDDYGGEVGEKQNGRARQNVILEWGYFVGKLGRNRVAAILKNDVEKPSDIDGVLVVNYNNDWKFDLQKELRDAGVIL